MCKLANARACTGIGTFMPAQHPKGLKANTVCTAIQHAPFAAGATTCPNYQNTNQDGNMRAGNNAPANSQRKKMAWS